MSRKTVLAAALAAALLVSVGVSAQLTPEQIAAAQQKVAALKQANKSAKQIAEALAAEPGFTPEMVADAMSTSFEPAEIATALIEAKVAEPAVVVAAVIKATGDDSAADVVSAVVAAVTSDGLASDAAKKETVKAVVSAASNALANPSNDQLNATFQQIAFAAGVDVTETEPTAAGRPDRGQPDRGQPEDKPPVDIDPPGQTEPPGQTQPPGLGGPTPPVTPPSGGGVSRS